MLLYESDRPDPANFGRPKPLDAYAANLATQPIPNRSDDRRSAQQHSV